MGVAALDEAARFEQGSARVISPTTVGPKERGL